MAFFTAASKSDFQHQLQAALAQHISEQALPQVCLLYTSDAADEPI